MRPIYIISLLAAALQTPLVSATAGYQNNQGRSPAIQARQTPRTDSRTGYAKHRREEVAGGVPVRLVVRGNKGSKERQRTPTPPPPPSPPPRLTAKYCTLCANRHVYTVCPQGETFHRDKKYHPTPGFCDDLPSPAGTGWRPW
ncbi:hypothetical protein PspLS_09231 [Pyricularia sp. CBS 133598]|nr:hypothetical protein PspLS_09231 [Pyricularia sp. CBS 133598]